MSLVLKKISCSDWKFIMKLLLLNFLLKHNLFFKKDKLMTSSEVFACNYLKLGVRNLTINTKSMHGMDDIVHKLKLKSNSTSWITFLSRKTWIKFLLKVKFFALMLLIWFNTSDKEWRLVNCMKVSSRCRILSLSKTSSLTVRWKLSRQSIPFCCLSRSAAPNCARN